MKLSVDLNADLGEGSGNDDELFAQAEAGATRAWDNWAQRDWNGRTVEQIIPPAFSMRKS